MNASVSTTGPSPSLANLSSVLLDDYHRPILEMAERNCGGSPAWRRRKIAEARELLALAQISNRLVVHWLDITVDLRAKVEMRVPVACLPDPTGPIQVEQRALLGIIYPEKAMFLPQPGYAFVRILAPGPVWHSNVSPDPNQVLCLGTSLPAGIPLKEIILMAYGALSMVLTQLDVMDPAGVLNPFAADWWQHNTNLIPLSKEPFLKKEVQHAG